MKMDMGNGEELRVRFKDYGFFVPTNLNGEQAIVDGVASQARCIALARFATRFKPSVKDNASAATRAENSPSE